MNNTAVKSRSDGDLARVLTQRERQVLTLVTEGLSNAAVAQALAVGPETVKSHLKSVYRKLDVQSRTEAAAFAHTRPALLADGASTEQ